MMDEIAEAMEVLEETYKKGGLRLVFDGIWVGYTRRYLFDILDSIFSPSLHEKLIMGPVLGYYPQIKEPRSFNEKIVHRKLFTDNPTFSTVSDKYTVRDYVRNKVGDSILNDVYCVTDNPDSIQFDDLPNEFVIKATHGSGRNIIVTDKSEINFDNIRSECHNWISEPFGTNLREYWYLQCQPRIIIEKLLTDESGKPPIDYKFYVFGGDVKYIHMDINRFSNHKRRFYDVNWNPQGFSIKYPLAEPSPPPDKFNKMIEIAESLGEDFDFARVDLYNLDNEGIIFGEITLAPGSGHARFIPQNADFHLGAYWDM